MSCLWAHKEKANYHQKTYNTRYSLVVTDPTTNPALIGLSMGERTGSRVFQWVWSYVLVDSVGDAYR
ncbi:hypothetical protein CTRU02_203875 [Colletotrichum truncatum]|uniref:Uncharacterized protein n=1 Tax=Colletotrichum truncatum TaxID=5467 RepID=A0ACC3ZAH2_COLTU